MGLPSAENMVCKIIYLEDKFMNDATKGLDQEKIYYLVKLSLGREYSAIRNIMLLFLYRRYKDELLNCFIKKQTKIT